MKIDNDYDLSVLLQNAKELSERSADSKDENEDVQTQNDTITISKEARDALSISADDINAAIELIEKVSSSYPEKDLKVKLHDIEIETSEPKQSSKLGNLIGGLLSGVIK